MRYWLATVMVVQHIVGLFIDPKRQWEKIRDDHCTIGKCYAVHVLILAMIPALSGYIGTTQVGWKIGAGDPIMLTHDTALIIAAAYYMVMLVGVFSMGWVIYLMGKTYGTEQPLAPCIVLAAYTATPIFLIGIMEVYPLLWLNMLIGLPALAYTVYLLYTGLPIMMGIPEERGFLFSTAVLGVGLIALVALLAITALLWGMGLEPAFTS